MKNTTFQVSEFTNSSLGFIPSLRQHIFATNIAFVDSYNHYKNVLFCDEELSIDGTLEQIVFPSKKRFLVVNGEKFNKISLLKIAYNTFQKCVKDYHDKTGLKETQHYNVLYLQNGCVVLCPNCEDVSKIITIKTLHNVVQTSILASNIAFAILAWRETERSFRKHQRDEMVEFCKLNHEKLSSFVSSSKCKLSDDEKQAIVTIIG